MAMNNLGINININFQGAGAAAQGANNAANALHNVGTAGTMAAQAIGNTKRQFQQLAGEFVKMVVGKHLIGVFAKLAMKTDQITMGMANIRTVMTDSFSPEQASKLKATLMDVGETTGKSFGDIATITKELISQGLSVEQVENLINPLMKFATVGDISVAKATDLTVALTNMGIASTQAGQAYDIMLNLANKTTIRAPEFVDIMTKVAPAAVVTHESFIELASSAALLRKSFSSGKEEATALMQTLYTLERSKIQDKVRKAFGVEVIADKSTGALKPLLGIIQEINLAMLKGKGGPSALYDIFGSRSGARILTGGIATLREGMDLGGKTRFGQDLIDTTRETATKSGGAVDLAFSEKMQALTPQIERLKVAFDNLIGTLGGSFASSLSGAVSGLVNITTSIRELLTQNPQLAEGLSFIVAHLARIGTFIGIFAIMSGGMAIARNALGPLITGLTTVGARIASTGSLVKGLGSIFSGMFKSLWGPLGIVLLLADLIPAIFSLFGEGDKSQDKSLEVGKSLKETSLANQNAANSLSDAATSLEAAAAEFNQIVAQYTKLMVKDFPLLNSNSMGSVNFAAGQSASIFGEDKGYTKELAEKVNRLFTSGGEDLTEQVVSEASRSLQILSKGAAAAAKKNVPGADKALKNIEELMKQVEEMQSPQILQSFKDHQLILAGRDPTRPGAPLRWKVQQKIDDANTKDITNMPLPPLPTLINGGGSSITAGATKFNEQQKAKIDQEARRQHVAPPPAANPFATPVPLDVLNVQLNMDGTSMPGTIRNIGQHEAVIRLKSQ